MLIDISILKHHLRIDADDDSQNDYLAFLCDFAEVQAVNYIGADADEWEKLRDESPIKMAIVVMVAWYYANPEGVAATNMTSLWSTVAIHLNPYRKVI